MKKHELHYESRIRQLNVMYVTSLDKLAREVGLDKQVQGNKQGSCVNKDTPI